MQFDGAEVASWVGGLLWPLARIGAMLSVTPVLGDVAVPRRVKLALALTVTLALAPLLPPAPAVEPFSATGLAITAQQLLIGLAIGLLVRLAFAALTLAGQVIATQMGLGFASLVDPQGGGQMPLLSHFYRLTGALIFLALNGHLLLLQLLAESFWVMPIGPTGLSADDLWVVVSWAEWAFAGAVMVALPAVTALLVVNLGFGVMSRAAPQLNIFAVGFPLTLMLGMLIVLFALPALLPQFQRLLEGALQTANRLLA